MTAVPSIGPFTGFPVGAFRFFEELERPGNNSRAWFDANRQRYEQDVRLPLEELLALAADEFGRDAKVFRPHRDVRFSPDKRPYKTHAGAVVGFRDGSDRPAYYVQVAADGILAAMGYYELSRDQLQRYRQAVVDQRTGPALTRAVNAARDLGLEVGGRTLSRGPRGVDRTHPRIDLLCHTSLTVARHWPLSAWMHDAGAAERIFEVWRAGGPMGRWLARHVGAPRHGTAH
jgi:uncharacterized protein (TIGR02453 family)